MSELTLEAEQFRRERDEARERVASLEAAADFARTHDAYALLLQVRDGLRAIDAKTANTFDGHGVRALLRLVEGEVGT